jgi:hypothetical protein
MNKIKLTLGMLASTLVLVSPAKSQYIGEASPLQVNLLGIVGVYAGTGPLPDAGGSLHSSVASLNLTTGGIIPTTVVTTGLLTGNTVGANSVVDSDAHVANIAILPSIIPALTVLRADLVESFAHASGASLSGSSNIVNLRVLGISVGVTGAVNQTYSVPGILNLTINRQVIANNTITVQALYLDIIDPLRIGRVIVSESVTGAPEPSPGVLVGLGLLVGGGAAIVRRRFANV